MKRYYACLLGNWVDITDEGTVEKEVKPGTFFKENDYCEYDYIHIQYHDKDYRIHPSMIQIVTE